MADRFPATQSSQAAILAKAELFTDFQLWPTTHIMDPRGWLRNFTEAEFPYALVLLDSFLFYSEPLVDALYRSAVHALSIEVAESATTLGQAKAMWRSFLGHLRVTYVEGEEPNPTDSGLVFARKARQVLAVQEDQIVRPVDALAAVRSDPTLPLLFVDDFVGSGNQMHDTWHRRYASTGSGEASFAQLAASGSGTFYYVPIIAAAKGMEHLRDSCGDLRVRPAHVLDDAYSLTHDKCGLWPEPLKPTARDLLYSVSQRAGITTHYKYGWQGFHDLALPVGFWHSVPDATLPLFFWDKAPWVPLLRRT